MTMFLAFTLGRFSMDFRDFPTTFFFLFCLFNFFYFLFFLPRFVCSHFEHDRFLNIHNNNRSWYREGSAIPLQAPINRGGSKDRPTTSTLSITPQREDDGAKYRCVVWNRAMPEGQSLETTVTLNVNCKYLVHISLSTNPISRWFLLFISEIYYENFTDKIMEYNFDRAVNREFIHGFVFSKNSIFNSVEQALNKRYECNLPCTMEKQWFLV